MDKKVVQEKHQINIIRKTETKIQNYSKVGEQIVDPNNYLTLEYYPEDTFTIPGYGQNLPLH